MKKLLSAILHAIPSFVFAQSVYMHEAQEEAENSEPISVLGIIVFAILVGVIYLIKRIICEARHKSERKKNEAKHEEFKRQQFTIKEGAFICPVCGKHVTDGNYETMWRILEGHSCTIKFCKDCGCVLGTRETLGRQRFNSLKRCPECQSIRRKLQKADYQREYRGDARTVRRKQKEEIVKLSRISDLQAEIISRLREELKDMERKNQT